MTDLPSSAPAGSPRDLNGIQFIVARAAEQTAELNQLRSQLSALREENERLTKELGEIRGRKFPLMDGPEIPWDAIAPFEAQARHNHGGQTLERLAERGGLSVREALHVMQCVDWNGDPRSRAISALPQRAAILELLRLCALSAPPLDRERSNGA